jgi:hypothetical protein
MRKRRNFVVVFVVVVVVVVAGTLVKPCKGNWKKAKTNGMKFDVSSAHSENILSTSPAPLGQQVELPACLWHRGTTF